MKQANPSNAPPPPQKPTPARAPQNKIISTHYFVSSGVLQMCQNLIDEFYVNSIKFDNLQILEIC